MKTLLILLLLVTLTTGCRLPAPSSLPPRARQDFNFYFMGWHRKTTPAEDAEALRAWANYVESRAAFKEADEHPERYGYDSKVWLAKFDAMEDDQFDEVKFMERTFPQPKK